MEQVLNQIMPYLVSLLVGGLSYFDFLHSN